MTTRLTDAVLLTLGFDYVTPTSYRGKCALFRYTPPRHSTKGYYIRNIQVSLGNYPDTNPNSGIVSLYSPKMKVFSFSNESVADEVQTFVDIPEFETPVAFYVTTLERLNAIYTALTDLEPFVYVGA